MMNLINYLSSLVDLGDEAIAMLAMKVRMEEYKKGEYLFRANDGCDDYFYIQEGLARVFNVNEKGSDITVWFVDRQNFSSSLHGVNPTGQRRPNSCVLLEDSMVVRITHADVMQLIAANHQIAQLAFVLLFLVTNKMVDMLTVLKMPAKVKLQNLLTKSPDIYSRVQSIYLASYLGVTPETFSRLKSQLVADEENEENEENEVEE